VRLRRLRGRGTREGIRARLDDDYYSDSAVSNLGRTYCYARDKVKVQFAQELFLGKTIFRGDGFWCAVAVDGRGC
jgi:hypothetical protein